jgi:hypothetical protein
LHSSVKSFGKSVHSSINTSWLILALALIHTHQLAMLALALIHTHQLAMLALALIHTHQLAMLALALTFHVWG